MEMLMLMITFNLKHHQYRMIAPLFTYAIMITWILKLDSKVTMSESVVLFDLGFL